MTVDIFYFKYVLCCCINRLGKNQDGPENRSHVCEATPSVRCKIATSFEVMSNTRILKALKLQLSIQYSANTTNTE